MTNLITSRRLWLGLGGTGLFLGLFFWRTDLSELGDALAQANYRWVVPAIAVWFVSAAFRSLRWHYLLHRLADLSTRTLYPIVIIGYMANNLLPLRTGEFVRAYVLGERHGVSKMSALGTIAVERVFDGVVLVGFLVAAGAVLGLNEELTVLAIAMSAAFAVLLALFVYVASSPERARRWTEWAIALLPGPLRERAHALASSFLDGLQSLQNPSLVVLMLGVSLAAWLLEAFMYYLVGRSFSIDEGFAAYMMVAAAANLAITLPSTSGGIGPFELLAKETLTFLGTGSAVAGAYAIALHGFLLLPVIAAGLVFLWAINLSLGRTLEEAGGEPLAAVAEQPE
ncbi:MAG TPA: lysylphosphatidylglycerol synthase transmembrane domain-containing protein [Dehalococcoidia bacterium]|nr:lysylphosphatidylglycerol synthase transmembrane domain-containing protein [Dehalococcoidia bacterium]